MSSICGEKEILKVSSESNHSIVLIQGEWPLDRRWGDLCTIAFRSPWLQETGAGTGRYNQYSAQEQRTMAKHPAHLQTVPWQASTLARPETPVQNERQGSRGLRVSSHFDGHEADQAIFGTTLIPPNLCIPSILCTGLFLHKNIIALKAEQGRGEKYLGSSTEKTDLLCQLEKFAVFFEKK
ncbi:hypothetical protein TURU_012293 [Turdus rufiventris]|nr:hypothetical protein TURU_012293 [Turdus rufiventris]